MIMRQNDVFIIILRQKNDVFIMILRQKNDVFIMTLRQKNDVFIVIVRHTPAFAFVHRFAIGTALAVPSPLYERGWATALR